MSEASLPDADGHVRVEIAGQVGIVTIDRPARRNALNLAIKAGIADAVERLDRTDAVRAIVICGSGGYFVAGTDIAEMADMTLEQHLELGTNRVFEVVRRCGKILIAAVEGFALGGGCELALACDMVVASEAARFSQPEIRVGIMPGGGGTQHFARAMARQRATWLLLTGEPISAREAHDLGFVSQLVAPGQALAGALALAGHVARMPRASIEAIRALVREGPDLPIDQALVSERQAFLSLFGGPDQKEGMRAFLDKREPRFGSA